MKLKSCGIIPVLQENNKKIKFLLVQHNSGHWSFPKGGIKKGETKIESAKRELKEETGITNCEILNNTCFTESYSFEKNGQNYHKTVKYFLAQVKNSKIKLLKSELQNYKWLEFEQAIKLITYPSAKNILKKAKKHIKKYYVPME